MERRDLYQDDLTEERQPTPAQRDAVAATEVLDPDASQDDGPGPRPRGSVDPDEIDDDDDEDDEEDEDDEDE
ncbi:MAG TPA: hypothetical protein VE591_12350 [Candidatus Acidoferrum sp.]|nr:hypothetical protein [Candidatus Acidoferrum sp.]